MFMPYLSGERTPHNDSHIRGSFIGIDVATTTADMTRAVLEGVTYAHPKQGILAQLWGLRGLRSVR